MALLLTCCASCCSSSFSLVGNGTLFASVNVSPHSVNSSALAWFRAARSWLAAAYFFSAVQRLHLQENLGQAETYHTVR